jgi:hypothetical protein
MGAHKESDGALYHSILPFAKCTWQNPQYKIQNLLKIRFKAASFGCTGGRMHPVIVRPDHLLRSPTPAMIACIEDIFGLHWNCSKVKDFLAANFAAH